MTSTFMVIAVQACAPEPCPPVWLPLACYSLNMKCIHQAPVLSTWSLAGAATLGSAEKSRRKISLLSAVKDTPGCPFLALRFLSTMRRASSSTGSYCLVLPHHRPRINGAKDCGLEPSRLWAKTNSPLFSCLWQVFCHNKEKNYYPALLCFILL